MPNGFSAIPLLNVQYRLSRVETGGGQDFITYNNVLLYGEYGNGGNAKFVEGFGAREFVCESNTQSFQFRKQTTVPVMLHEFEEMQIIGDHRGTGPNIRSWLSLTIVPAGFDVDWSDTFNWRPRDIDANHGNDIDAWNSDSLGTNTDLNFYDRSVRVIGGRNMLNCMETIQAETVPDPIGGPLIEKEFGIVG